MQFYSGGIAISGIYGLGFNQSDGAGIGIMITYAVFILVGFITSFGIS